MLKIPEDIFWNADIPFLENVAENKVAYDSWYNSVMRKEREKIRGRKK